jgi:hypothetical protein
MAVEGQRFMETRIEATLERVARVEEWSRNHEKYCEARQREVVEKIEEETDAIMATRKTMASNGRLYLTIAFLLYMLELGKLTIPEISEFILKLGALH